MGKSCVAILMAGVSSCAKCARNKRVRERAERGLHFIDPDVVRRRYSESLKNLPKVLPLVDIAFIYDNWSRPMHPYVVYADSTFSELDTPVPEWIRSALNLHASEA